MVNNMIEMYKKLGISEKVYNYGEKVLCELKETFDKTDKIAEYNQLKVISAMQKNRVAATHFAATTGYGYNDAGRDKLEMVYADCFKTEAALVRPQITCGTHALAVALSANLLPGDELLCPAGGPYDTLEEVIGIRNSPCSLAEYGVTSLWALKQKPRMTHALDGEITHLWGATTIEEEICGLTFKLSPKSFFQINRDIAAKLYTKAVSLAGLKSRETAIDAYCGVGTIGMLAAGAAGQVFGVELIPDAVEDAKLAAKKHGIENIDFVAGRCEVILPKDEALKKASVIFLDPPRKGCGRELLDAIAKVGIPRVVYVSCDPATLARDVAIMKEWGYTLTNVAPYDMFPQTGHVETVVLLSREKVDDCNR